MTRDDEAVMATIRSFSGLPASVRRRMLSQVDEYATRLKTTFFDRKKAGTPPGKTSAQGRDRVTTRPDDDTWRTDRDGNALEHSGIWLETVGHQGTNDLGYRWQDHIHPEDLPRLQEEVDRHWARRESYMTSPTRVRHHRTGKYVCLRWIGNPTADGGYKGWAEEVKPRAAKVPRPQMRRIVSLAQNAIRNCRCLGIG